jgi:hypothetical protein
MGAKRPGRKLLVASIGVAAVSYVACGSGSTVANLMAPPENDGGGGGSNDAGTDTPPRPDAPPINWDVVANLAPPPHD